MACDDDPDMIPSTPSRHVSMEGGLDDSSLLAMGSPKMVVDVSENKENIDVLDFARPRIPTPKKSKIPGGTESNMTRVEFFKIRNLCGVE